uniref:Uncharacterized protein n=1 Tax=Utricularia reniformis TaxID=192314 RepID=A0A1Y0B2W3_9LAMI|nr:hypothetical protein AEK19_MT1547 [Utricularia reniformis]ART31734.1 hypothetical protein AEK19_MT1547 [Utricularia reniformis]
MGSSGISRFVISYMMSSFSSSGSLSIRQQNKGRPNHSISPRIAGEQISKESLAAALYHVRFTIV